MCCIATCVVLAAGCGGGDKVADPAATWVENLVNWPGVDFPDHGDDSPNKSLGFSSRPNTEIPELFRPFYDVVDFRDWCVYLAESATHSGAVVSEDSFQVVRTGTLTTVAEGACTFTSLQKVEVLADSTVSRTYTIEMMLDEISNNETDWIEGRVNYEKQYHGDTFASSTLTCWLAVQGQYRGFFQFKEEQYRNTAIGGLIQHQYFFRYPQEEEMPWYDLTEFGDPIESPINVTE